MRGKTDLERAEIIQWFGFADSEILPASCAWVFPLLGIMPYNKQVQVKAIFINSPLKAKMVEYSNYFCNSRRYINISILSE